MQADLLQILGEKNVLYEFVGILTMRCSYLLVNKEYAKEILSEASEGTLDKKYGASVACLID
jgi:sister chromatid cohesion protein PDS5